jgi:superfamily II DNA or RNA helicase
VLKYEQNYVENKYVKPLEQTHTIVMAHNLNILHYIYKKFVCKNLASIGYYIGGMSEAELKKSEKKQVVLASYQMSSEGLDIPTLNAEFLITPKTDIVQTVGRILRAKHAYSHPIVFDVVDSHDCFKNQWSKRRIYYKKQNYRIIGITNTEYTADTTKWKTIYDRSSVSNAVNRKCSEGSDENEDDDSDTKVYKCLIRL